ncbi:MAG: tetratricopeptide repeat protein, partial [Anaerolineales bacterium]
MAKTKNRPENPYRSGNPVPEESGFFGRKEAMKWVQEKLQYTHNVVLVIRGQRRIGKTSLLFQIQRSLPTETFLPVYFNLEGRSRQKQKIVLAALADDLLRAANLSYKGKRSSALPKTEDNATTFQREFLPYYFEQINPRRGVVLLDEFDVLQDEREAVDLMQFFSKLTTEDENLIFVITTGRDPADLSKNYSAIFKGASQTKIGVLEDKDSAVALVRQAEANKTLKFRDDAVERVLDLTHSHPFFAQLLCQRLWQLVHPKGKSVNDQIPEITIADVEAAVEPALEDGELNLNWMWGGFSSAEKIFVAALAAISEENKPISENEVISTLSRHAERFRNSTVEVDAPRYLLERDFLEKSGEDQYSFAIEMFRRWVKANRPLQRVKRELDESSETAEAHFTLGEDHFEQQRFEEAKLDFEMALKEKPDHLKSLIRLGETYTKMDAFESAIQVLDKAYNLDDEEPRTTYAYARALVNYAQEKYKKGDITQALEFSERALRLSPQESGAKRIKSSIWNKRGDEALQRG